MSKQKGNTRDKIRDKALEMFNERGIEYVGLREMAALLNIRVGNITYYFPTKDDLVYELSVQLRQQNAAVMVVPAQVSMLHYLTMLHRMSEHHLQYKCLLLSFVHVMKQNKRIAAAYQQTQTERSTTIRTYMQALWQAGYLKGDAENKIPFLVSTQALISRFWISEAAISFSQLKDEAQLHHYLHLVTNLLLPFTTAKAKSEIEQFEQQLKRQEEQTVVTA